MALGDGGEAVTWDEVAHRHRTDKSSIGHGYMDHYERILGDQPIHDVLEIGVDRGNSLRTWCELFPSARVVGVDINPTCADVETDATVVIADATDAGQVTEALLPFAPWDLIIDDGSHQLADVQASVELLLPYVRVGGRYVIEDIVIGCGGSPAGALLSFLADRPDVGEIWAGRSRAAWGDTWPSLVIVRRV